MAGISAGRNSYGHKVYYGSSAPIISGIEKQGDEYLVTPTGDNTSLPTQSYIFDGTQRTNTIPSDIFVVSGSVINPNTATAKIRLVLSNGNNVDIDVSTLEDTMTNAQILATFTTGSAVTLNSTASTISFLGSDGQRHTLEIAPTNLTQASTSGGTITVGSGTATIGFYQSTPPVATFVGEKRTDTSTTPSTQKVRTGAVRAIDNATLSITANNDLGINGGILQQGFPLVKNTDTLLSTFSRSFTGTNGYTKIRSDGGLLISTITSTFDETKSGISVIDSGVGRAGYFESSGIGSLSNALFVQQKGPRTGFGVRRDYDGSLGGGPATEAVAKIKKWSPINGGVDSGNTVYIENSAVGQTGMGLLIENGGNGQGFYVSQRGIGYGATTNQIAAQIQQKGGGSVLALSTDGGDSGGILGINSYILESYTNEIQTGTAYLHKLWVNNASSTRGVLEIINNGTGISSKINQNGAAVALDVRQNTNTTGVQLISAATTATGVYIAQNTVSSNTKLVQVARGALDMFNVRYLNTVSRSAAVNIGDFYFRVDTNGQLRLKGTQPTTDLDGITPFRHRKHVGVSANYGVNIGDGIISVNATSGNVIITLPSAVGNDGAVVTIKSINLTANTITIASGGGLIEGGANYVLLGLLLERKSVTLYSSGANWFVYGDNRIQAPNYTTNALAIADATLITGTLYTVTVAGAKQVFQK